MSRSEPLFLARDVVVAGISPLKGKMHARLTLHQGAARLGGVLFHAPPSFFELRPGSRPDMVFHFQLNDWNGRVTPVLSVRNWRETC